MISHVGCDHCALAMADEADSFRVDLLARFQVRDGCLHVRGKFKSCCFIDGTRRTADSAFVVTKDGNSLSRQVVGQNQKWLMPGEGFVPIKRARTGNENRSWKRSRSLRQGNCAGKLNVGGRTREGNDFFSVWIGMSWGLRSLQWKGLIGSLEHQILFSAGLRPFPCQSALDRIEPAFEGTIHGGNFKIKLRLFQADLGRGQSAHALIKTIECSD